MEQINIKLSDSALSDLERIESYISEDSPTAARKFISRIFDKIHLLHEYPFLGKPVPELKNPNIRELLQNKYRIIYEVAGIGEVNILRIVHGFKLLDLDL